MSYKLLVLILVIMEYGLGHLKEEVGRAYIQNVLILVIMEYGLGQLLSQRR